MEKEGITFMARCKGWEAVKKASIDETTTNQEIAFALSGMQETMDRKAYEFLGLKTGMMDEYALSLAKGRKKAWGSLGEIFSNLKPAEISAKLKEACPDPKLLPVAETYLLSSLLKALGFDTNPNRVLLSKIYPELKIAKPRGNFGKKKKE